MGAAIITAGLMLAAAGGGIAWCEARSAGAVATGYGLRNGGLRLTPAQVSSSLAGFGSSTSLLPPTADEEAALTFIYYEAADQAARSRNKVEYQNYLKAAQTSARRVVSLSPTRGDMSLVLAEIEYLLGAPRDAVEHALMLSFMTSPRELWIARRRIGLGLRLAPVDRSDLEQSVEADVRLLGEPYQSLGNYMALAQAAANAGPVAIALVREILARGHPWPFKFFNEDLQRLQTIGARSQ